MNYESRCAMAEAEIHDALIRGKFIKWILASRRLERLHAVRESPRVSLMERYRLWRNRRKVVASDGHINVFFLLGDVRKTLRVDPEWTCGEIAYMFDLPTYHCWWSFGGRPLRMTLSLKDMGVHNNATIIITGRLMGGAQCPLPLYTHVRECEQEIFESSLLVFEGQFELQAHEFEDYYSSLITILKSQDGRPQWVLEHLENFFQVVYWSRKCTSRADYTALTALAFKIFTGKGVVSTMFSFAQSELQGDFSEYVSTARDWFDLTMAATKNPLVDKMRKVYTYLLVQGFFKKSDCELDEEVFAQLDKFAVKKYNSRAGLVMSIIDAAITIAERYDAYRLTGDWTAIIHDDVHYAKWSKTADKLISLAPFTSNLVPHGTTYFTFISDLNDAVEKGDAMVKYCRKTNVDTRAIARKLQALQLLKNTEITRRASQKERKSPFGVLVHGTSSVAKSSFTKMLFYFYGKIHGLDTDDHFRYVRNPAEEYWNNFDTSKWCIQLDDIAFLLSKKSATVDPTLEDLLRVVNNVPYVPSQAALEDKGKTPVLAKLVIATTNAPDLNAADYFHCPLAVRRRLPFVVKVEPKEEYKHANGKFIDPTKLAQPEKGFPDYWVITVQKLVPEDHNGHDSARLEDVKVFTDVHEFLKFYGDASKEHEKIQTKAAIADNYMKDIKVCSLCYSMEEKCECTQAMYVPDALYWPVLYLLSCLADFAFRVLIVTLGTAAGRLASQYSLARMVIWSVGRCMSRERQITISGHLVGARNYTLRFNLGQIAKVALVLTQFYVGWQLAQKVQPASRKKSSDEVAEQVEEIMRASDEGEIDGDLIAEGAESDEETFEVQGNTHGTTEADLAKTESSNVWYNAAVELSQFDLPVASASLVDATPPQIRDLFAPNCVRIELVSECGRSRFRTGAVFLKGQRLIWNNHTVCVQGRYSMTIISEPTSCGISSNVTVSFHTDELLRLLDYDLVALTVRGVPPRKDITKFWNITQHSTSMIVGVRRDRSGCAEYTVLHAAQYVDNMYIEALNRRMNFYLATGPEMTKVGDCGTLGVALTPRGPSILGLHTIGRDKTAGFLYIPQDVLLVLLGDTVVSGGGCPMFTLNGEQPSLLPVHPKSVVRYLKEGYANVYGMLVMPTPKARSRVRATPIQELVCETLGYTVGHGPPAMSGWEPIYNNIKEMVRPHLDVDQTLVDHCVEEYVSEVVVGLTELHGDKWHGELVVLSDYAAVNGLCGVKYIDRLNVSTSMGFPWNRAKKAFLHPEPREDCPEGVNFGDDVWERVRRIEECYADGCRAYPIFTAHLKDEAVTFAKIDAKKTRVFTGAPIDFSIVMRKFLLSFVRLLQQNKFIFEAAPGTVTQSIEWDHFYRYLTHFGVSRMVAGDYGKFDKRMVSIFILAAFDIIVKVLQAAGMSDEDVKPVRAMAHDIAFPVVCFKGDIIEFFGSNPSGQPLTVIVNCLVNSLYMRYAYCQLNPAGKSCKGFRENVHLMTYGDDNIMGVSESADWFNHEAIQEAMKVIGVEYTMADKTAESIPFIDISECSFLKRKWRMEEELGVWVAPLEEESILKSLTIWVPSRTIDKYAQTVAVISAANNEYFFHGKALFNERRAFFADILAQYPYNQYVTDSTLPDWDDLIQRFRHASQEFNNVPIPKVGIGISILLKEQSGNTKIEETSVETVTGRTVPACPSQSAGVQSSKTLFQLQSEEVTEPSVASSSSSLEMTSETVTFIDNAEGEVVMAGSEINPIAKVDGTEDLQLGRFLGRPTAISSFTWSTSDTIGVKSTILPWHLFLNNANIKKKIDNFAFLRGKLHIKVMVNGTPFQFGLLRTCYSPLLGLVSNKIRAPPSGSEPLLTPYSQQPGFFITPAANAGGQMELPFFYHKNWLDITSASNVQNFGTLNFVVYAPLGVAVTGGTTSVTVQVFAWMTDVELMGSTASLALQGDEYDEGGSISRPASAVANVASYLTKVPVIGPFARATEIGARAVGSIAKIFGFTNVPVIDNVHALMPMNAPMLASGHIGTAVQKLSLDPKQELSLDPTLHGLKPNDELSIPYIKDKESYIGSGTWSTANTVDTLLFCARVTPALYQRANIPNSAAATIGQRVYHSPISYMGTMFYNWRGSLVLRIKIVATKFHKGRLKISYDPRADITTTNPDVNTVYTHIVDIGEEDDIEIEIPYHQDTPWLLIDKGLGDNWNTTGSLPNRVGTDNGVITVRVLTTLTAPATGSVKLLAFMRGGDDFEFANPAGYIGSESSNRVPSFFALQAEDITSVTPTRYVLGEKSTPHPERYAQNFGEAINSLRAVVHRYVTMDTVWIDSLTAARATILGKTLRIMPYTPGFDPSWPTTTSANKVVAASGTAPYAFNTMSHMAYVAGMFLGYRGGANYVITPGHDAYGPVVSDVRVMRVTQSLSNKVFRYYGTFATLDPTTSTSTKANIVNRSWYYTDGLGGMAQTTTGTNGSISFQLPDYKLANFSLADPANYVEGFSEDGTDKQAALVQFIVRAPTGVDTSYLSLQTQVSAAPDWTCLFWLCCPTLDYLTGNPTPV